MINQKIGIIGGGNMGEAIIKGLVQGRNIKLFVSDASKERLKFLKKKYKVSTFISNTDLVKQCSIIILAVKPQIMDAVLSEIKDVVGNVGARRAVPLLIISIAAGIKTAFIEKRLGKVSCIRAMPNMPALIAKGVSAVCAGKFTKPGDRRIAANILSSLGKVVEVKEELMDAVTAISGSGPAYFFFLIEVLTDIGKKQGLSEEVAAGLAAQTAFGASSLVLETRQAPSVLRQKVTSKGGTTEAAFEVFKDMDLGGILQKGIEAAIRRSKEMSSSCHSEGAERPKNLNTQDSSSALRASSE